MGSADCGQRGKHASKRQIEAAAGRHGGDCSRARMRTPATTLLDQLKRPAYATRRSKCGHVEPIACTRRGGAGATMRDPAGRTRQDSILRGHWLERDAVHCIMQPAAPPQNGGPRRRSEAPAKDRRSHVGRRGQTSCQRRDSGDGYWGPIWGRDFSHRDHAGKRQQCTADGKRVVPSARMRS